MYTFDSVCAVKEKLPKKATARMIEVRINGVFESSKKRQSTKNSYNLNNIKWA